MFKIHTDSIQSNTWTVSGRQDAYTTFLYSPLKNITDVSLVGANFQATGTNVAYLYVEQLSTQYNDATGYESGSAASKASIRGALARFDVQSSGRTVYHQYDYDTKTTFRTPLNKLDRISVELLDEKGQPLTTSSNVFITFSFNCAQPSAQAPSPRPVPVVVQNRRNNITRY